MWLRCLRRKNEPWVYPVIQSNIVTHWFVPPNWTGPLGPVRLTYWSQASEFKGPAAGPFASLKPRPPRRLRGVGLERHERLTAGQARRCEQNKQVPSNQWDFRIPINPHNFSESPWTLPWLPGVYFGPPCRPFPLYKCLQSSSQRVGCGSKPGTLARPPNMNRIH